jgi:diguanylate cyclase (GGDEF)-like protein
VEPERNEMGMTRSAPGTRSLSSEAGRDPVRKTAASVWIHDQDGVHGSVSVALLRRGYDVTVFRSGEEWREALESERPDVMIVDLDDPSASESLSASIESTEKTKLIVIAGTGDIDRRLEAVRMGANAMFVRPVVAERMVLAVDRLVMAAENAPCQVLMVSSAGLSGEIRALNETVGIRLSVVPPRSLLSSLTAVMPECIIIDAQDAGIDPEKLVRLIRISEGYAPVPIAVIERIDGPLRDGRLVKVVGTQRLSFRVECEELPAVVAVMCELRRSTTGLAGVDELTGLYRDAGVADHVRELFELGARFRIPITCIAVTIDDYQRIVDERGADAAQMTVKNLAVIAQTVARETGLIIRASTDEVITYLLGVTTEEARVKAGQMLNVFGSVPREHEGDTFFATLSVGIAAVRGDYDSDRVLAEARVEVLRAQQAGGSRVEIAAQNKGSAF